MTTEPSTTNSCKCQADKDADDQALLMAYMGELYLVDGRYKPDHPQHGLFNGLFQKYGYDN